MEGTGQLEQVETDDWAEQTTPTWRLSSELPTPRPPLASPTLMAGSTCRPLNGCRERGERGVAARCLAVVLRFSSNYRRVRWKPILAALEHLLQKFLCFCIRWKFRSPH